MTKLSKLTRKELEDYTKRLERKLERTFTALSAQDLTYRKYQGAIEILSTPV